MVCLEAGLMDASVHLALPWPHRQEGMNDVSLDGAQGLVLDHHKDLFLLLQVDEVSKPRFLGQPRQSRGCHDGNMMPGPLLLSP